MSSVQEIQSKIREATMKLEERQNDVKWWLKELDVLNRELAEAQREETRRASEKKAA